MINEFSDLFEPVFDAMQHYGYAADRTAESWFHAFEEHFIRAAEIWVSAGNDFKASERAAAFQAQYGFKFVPIIVKYLQSHWEDIGNIEEFISECLSSCRSSR